MSEILGTSHYAQLDRVKLKLRMDQLPDDKQDTIDEELENYINEVDEAINRELLARLGFFDEHGNPIEIPLTEDSNIPLDEDLILIATKWAVGKYRTEQNAEDELERNAVVEFENYLDKRFGWGQGNRLHLTNLKTRIVVDRFGAGEGAEFNIEARNFRRLSELETKLGGKVCDTNPVKVFSDDKGRAEYTAFVPVTEEGEAELQGDAHVLDVREIGINESQDLDDRTTDYQVGNMNGINVAQLRFLVVEHTIKDGSIDAILI